MERRFQHALLRVAAFAALAAACHGCGGAEEGPSTPGLAAADSAADGNRPPEIRSLLLEPPQPSIDDTLRALATVHDAEGDAVDLHFAWTVDGELLQEGEASELELDELLPGALVEVSVTASAAGSRSQPASASATVINRPPSLAGFTIDPTQSVYPGDPIVVTPTGTDPDGDRVEYRYTWFVNDQPADGDEARFATEGLSQGDRVRVRVHAVDRMRARSQPLDSADVIVRSGHPEIVSTPPGLTGEGTFHYEVQVEDPDGSRGLRYRLTEAPEGMRIDAITGVVDWRPQISHAGSHPVAITVRDPSGLETTQRFQVTVRSDVPAAPADDAGR